MTPQNFLPHPGNPARDCRLSDQGKSRPDFMNSGIPFPGAGVRLSKWLEEVPLCQELTGKTNPRFDAKALGLAEVRAMMETQAPIKIPVEYVNTNGNGSSGEDGGETNSGGFRRMAMSGVFALYSLNRAAEAYSKSQNTYDDENLDQQFAHQHEYLESSQQGISGYANKFFANGGSAAERAMESALPGSEAIRNTMEYFNGGPIESLKDQEADLNRAHYDYEYQKKQTALENRRTDLKDEADQQDEIADLRGTDKAKQEIENEFAATRKNRERNPQYFNPDGTLTKDAQRLKDDRLAPIEYEEQLRSGEDSDRAALARAEASGDSKGTRVAEYNMRLEDARRAAFNESALEGARFNTELAPEMLTKFKRSENLRAFDDAAEQRYQQAVAGDRAAQRKAQTQHDPEAEARAANQAIDDRIKLLRDEAANEAKYGDAEKAKKLATEASAAATEGATEKEKNLMEAREAATLKMIQQASELRNLDFEGRETSLRAHGMSYTADKEAADNKWETAKDQLKARLARREITQAQYNTGLVAAGNALDADLDAIEQHRDKELRGVATHTAEYQWNAANRPRMAELTGIESEIAEQLLQHKDDPEYQRFIRDEGAAQLTAFAHPNQKSQWYDSAADYAKSLNTSYLNRDHEASREALEAAKIMKEAGGDIKQMVNKLLDGPPLHIVKNGY